LAGDLIVSLFSDAEVWETPGEATTGFFFSDFISSGGDFDFGGSWTWKSEKGKAGGEEAELSFGDAT
jgi:hypothetical protein